MKQLILLTVLLPTIAFASPSLEDLKQQVTQMSLQVVTYNSRGEERAAPPRTYTGTYEELSLSVEERLEEVVSKSVRFVGSSVEVYVWYLNDEGQVLLNADVSYVAESLGQMPQAVFPLSVYVPETVTPEILKVYTQLSIKQPYNAYVHGPIPDKQFSIHVTANQAGLSVEFLQSKDANGTWTVLGTRQTSVEGYAGLTVDYDYDAAAQFFSVRLKNDLTSN